MGSWRRRLNGGSANVGTGEVSHGPLSCLRRNHSRVRLDCNGSLRNSLVLAKSLKKTSPYKVALTLTVIAYAMVIVGLNHVRQST